MELVGKQFVLQIHPEDMRQMCIFDCVVKPCLGTAVRELFASPLDPGILGVQLAHPG